MVKTRDKPLSVLSIGDVHYWLEAAIHSSDLGPIARISTDIESASGLLISYDTARGGWVIESGQKVLFIEAET